VSNNRAKGKRGERFFAILLREYFPLIKRNQAEQADAGGTDFVNTNPFNFEVKFGKAYKIKKMRDIIDQTESEGSKENLSCALIKPDREKEYVVLPFTDFLTLLKWLKTGNSPLRQ